MKYLLDTHTIVWAGEHPERLSPPARKALENPQAKILVSAASAWEIATKVRKGKWPEAVRLEADFVKFMTIAGFDILPISAEDALRAARFASSHKDPFDRQLVAQCSVEALTLVTRDKSLKQYAIPIIAA